MSNIPPTPGSRPSAPNPSNLPEKRAREATRIPMSVPQLKLEIPEIPGLHLHWMLGTNVSRALRAGYRFIEPDEVDMVNSGLADNVETQGSTDMGSRISAHAGGLVEGTTEPQRLYLMGLPQELWEQDQQALEARNEQVAAALRGGQPMPGSASSTGEQAVDVKARYLKTGQDLFIPRHLRRR